MSVTSLKGWEVIFESTTMKYPLTLIVFLSLAGALFTSARPAQKLRALVVYVYICNSEGSVAYHSTTDCKGLNKCTHEVLTVTLDDAVDKYKRRACKLCY